MMAMHKLLLFPLLTALVCICTGCVELTMLLRVNTDGSGNIRMRMVMQPDQLRNNLRNAKLRAQRLEEEMQAQGMPGSSNLKMSDEDIDGIIAMVDQIPMYDKDALQKMASQLGQGVRLVRSKELTDGRRGFMAEFAFTDVTKLRLEQAGSAVDAIRSQQQGALTAGGGMLGGMAGMAGGMTGGGPGGGTATAPSALIEPSYRFEFTKGSPAQLVIVPLNQGRTTPSAPTHDMGDMPPEMPPDMMDPMQQMMTGMTEIFKPLLAGVRVSAYLQTGGRITETNADHQLRQHPNTITILYVDAGQAINSFTQETMMKLQQLPGEPSIEALTALGIKGLKAQDPRKQLSVKFQ